MRSRFQDGFPDLLRDGQLSSLNARRSSCGRGLAGNADAWAGRPHRLDDAVRLTVEVVHERRGVDRDESVPPRLRRFLLHLRPTRSNSV